MDEAILKYADVMKKCALFADLDGERLISALRYFNATAAHCEKGEFIHHAGEKMDRFGLVLKGVVQVCTDDLNGNRMIMANVTAGNTFGEALCFLRIPAAPVYIYATEPVVFLWLSTDHVSQMTRSAEESEWKNRFITIVAERSLKMNSRVQILSKLTLREKLNAFFTDRARKAGSDTFILPLSRDDMADYLGTNRSALSRELSKMKKEGIIDFYKGSFRILRK